MSGTPSFPYFLKSFLAGTTAARGWSLTLHQLYMLTQIGQEIELIGNHYWGIQYYSMEGKSPRDQRSSLAYYYQLLKQSL